MLFFCNIIIDWLIEMRYIGYRLDHGSQVGNSNSEEFPFYTSKNPEGLTSGVLACSLFNKLTHKLALSRSMSDFIGRLLVIAAEK